MTAGFLPVVPAVRPLNPKVVALGGGHGLFAVVELVRERTRREPLSPWPLMHPSLKRLIEAGLAQGVSFAARGNLLLLAPPLVIGERELSDALDLLDRLLGKLAVSFATPGNLTDTIPRGGKHA